MQLPAVDTGGTVLTTLGYLCLLLGVIYFAYWALKRLGFHGMGMRSGSNAPQLVTRLMLGHKQNVSVVYYRGKEFMLGVTDEHVTLLKEFEVDEEWEEESIKSVPVKPISFANLLRRKTEDE
ncbi:flagellar biosynthetic protein FliO [Pseudodesulfovibrio sp. zrk46]|nr:flagellar biosynthetic protein FliO [Pseudodesulfovibrio sp. zrk46]